MYIIEGNIGTGKSTFLKLLKKNLASLDITLEAVDYWQQESAGKSILQNFYEIPQRWAYTMETISLKMRVQEHVKLQTSPTVNIVERSIYSGFHCFAKNSFEQGFLSTLEWNMYNSWFDFATAKKCLPPQGFIYLQADPQVSYNRTIKRKRNAEKTISYEYLNQIHKKHENFLIHKKDIHPTISKTPVLTINCNEDFLDNQDYCLEQMQLVKKFIQKTSQPFQQKADFISLQTTV